MCLGACAVTLSKHAKSNDTRTLKILKKLNKCWDDLIKKAWGKGRDGVCSTMTMSVIHKPHPHKISLHVVYLYASSLNQFECICIAVTNKSTQVLMPWW